MNEICKDCRKPVHWAPMGADDGGAWYHDSLNDSLICAKTAKGPVEMVLSGPEA